MSDQICSELERIGGISTADSWPTGTANDGPEQYGLVYHSETITRDDVLSHLDTLIHEQRGPGFFLEANTDEVGHYPLVVTVHHHPWANEVGRLLDAIDTISAYGLDWTPENVWSHYDGSPYLNLVAPGALDCWIEAANDDYDTALDELEETLTNGEVYPDRSWSVSYPDYTLEVHSADSDQCHFSLTFESVE